VRAIARHVAELFRPGAPTHELTVEVPEGPVVVTCDPMRLEQVLGNLVSNAIKYSPEGGPVRMSVRRHEGEAQVRVEDSGMGIPAEEQARLFEPFRRGGLDRRSTIPGVGLGLYIARRIVEAHGGRITLRSEPGLGSEFTVALPAAPAGGEAGRPADAHEPVESVE
jgi:signal transduction histidine kinase